MIASRTLGLLALFGALLILLPIAVESTCVGTASARTLNMGLSVDGDTINLWPIYKDKRVLDFYNLTVKWTLLEEFLYDPDAKHRCAYDADPVLNVQSMDLIEDFSCVVTASTADLHPNATVQTIKLNYTSSQHPDLKFAITFFFSDTNFAIYPSNDTTYVDPGETYSWVFDPNKIKFSIEVENFPFLGPNAPNASYVLISYEYTLSIVETMIYTWDLPYTGGINLTRTDGATLTWTLEKSGLYDGKPVVIADRNVNGVKDRTGTPTTFALPPATATVPLCSVDHFKTGIYDPSFITLFAPDPTRPNSPLTPEQQKKKRDYTIGASVGSVLGIGVVLAVALVAWGKPTLNRLADPQRMPKAAVPPT